MAEITAICIKCGTFKSGVSHACPRCSYRPKDERDVAKSLILSESFDAGDRVFGKSDEELRRISEILKGGGSYAFDEKELELALEEYRSFSTFKPLMLVKDVARWLAGPALLLLLVCYVVWSSRG